MTPPSRSRRVDPRTVAVLALLASLVAITLELAYTIGHFVFATFHQIGS